jgi:hypothetical protein
MIVHCTITILAGESLCRSALLYIGSSIFVSILLQLSVIATNYDVMGFRVPSSVVNSKRLSKGNLRCPLTGPCLLTAETTPVKFKVIELVFNLLTPISIYLAKVRTASWYGM